MCFSLCFRGFNCCASCALFSRCTSCQTSGCRIFCLVRPGCLVCPWAAARPPSTAHDLPGSVWSLYVPVGGGPPASRPRGELRSARPPSTAHDLPSSVWSLCVPVGGGPPARSPHASLTARSGRSRGPPWPCRHPPAPLPGPPVPPAPSTPVGPGRCSAALRVGSKPGQAPHFPHS